MRIIRSSDFKPSRREAIRLGAAGAAAFAGLSMLRGARADCPVSPTQTEGPYWVDEMLNRSDIRSDPTTGTLQQGLPLRLGINVSESQGGVCQPLVGAYVDIWHCSWNGVYSDVAANNTVGQRWLRGYQVTDAHGNVRFLTVYPGYYVGRTVHIHWRVRKFSGTTVTGNHVSQLYFDDTVTDGLFARVAPYNTRGARGTRNTNDGIYNSALLCRLADNGTHVVASLNAVVNFTPGLVTPPGVTPPDPEAEEHKNDFGGGNPAVEPLFTSRVLFASKGGAR